MIGRPPKPAIDRFLNLIEKKDSCWFWKGWTNDGGYGYFRAIANVPQVRAHRFAYEFFKGLIPMGFTIDHLCRNRICVNPEHLEAVSLRENVLRGDGPAAINAKKEFCPRGHSLSGDNLVLHLIVKGIRECKICFREQQKLYQRELRRRRRIQK